MQNLFLIIDTYDIRDNDPADLQNAQYYRSLLMTEDFNQQDVICCYDVFRAFNFELEDEKIIKWQHYPNED